METYKEIFPGVSDDVLREIKAHSFTKTYKAGEVLFNEGDFVKYLPVVLNGSLKMVRDNEEGKEIYLYSLQPGESCLMSFMGAISHEPSKVRLVAEEESELLLIPSNFAAKWIDEYPSWNRFVLKIYNKRLEELLNTVNAIAFQKMDQRLLESLSRRQKATGSNEISVTHQQLANELGTHREVVSRLLKQLEKDKKVVLGRNKITLLGPV